VPLAHPLPDETAVLLLRSLEPTAAELGPDADNYRKLFAQLVSRWDDLGVEFLQPLVHWPRNPWLLARFGFHALHSASRLIKSRFCGERAAALFCRTCRALILVARTEAIGCVWACARSARSLRRLAIAERGSQRIADALASLLRSLGGEIETGLRIEDAEQIPLARAVLFDVTPRQLLRIMGERLPRSYQDRLRKFRYGPGVFKMDYALRSPIPWRAAACARAGTVHVCGAWEEVAASEREISEGKPPENPFVLVAQPSLFDPSRAPSGKHTAWAYCHVPHGSTFDMQERIENQIERFAPGFRNCVLARHSLNTAQMEQHNANLVGGDINGGLANLRQLIARPIFGRAPYRTPLPGIYLCSSSTPPGGGVHGMCGFHAASAALKDLLRNKFLQDGPSNLDRPNIRQVLECAQSSTALALNPPRLPILHARREEVRTQARPQESPAQRRLRCCDKDAPNLAVGYPRPVHRSFPRLAGSGFQQLLSIMNNGFDIFQKLIEIRVFSVSCFAHNSEGCGYWLTL
jgi:phytoene dehydrogenase-like protein